LDQQTSQLANTITRKPDVLAMAEITAAVTGSNVVPGHDWGDLGTVGPADDLTPSSELPSADMSAAKLASDLQEFRVKHGLLVLHPNEAHSLSGVWRQARRHVQERQSQGHVRHPPRRRRHRCFLAASTWLIQPEHRRHQVHEQEESARATGACVGYRFGSEAAV
jgi:hypothetical protein